MYCSSCGTALTPGLSYCNRCGAALSVKEPAPIKTSEVSAESLVWAIVAVCVGGLAMLIGLIAVMKEANLDVPFILAITALSFMLMIGTSGVFGWMLLRSKRGSKETGDKTQRKGLAARESAVTRGGLFPEPAHSVTEHTTRTLEPASSERKAE